MRNIRLIAEQLFEVYTDTDLSFVVTPAQLCTFAEHVIAIERINAAQSLTPLIPSGPLSGDGCDQVAQRNGAVLAHNVLVGRAAPVCHWGDATDEPQEGETL